MDNAKAVEIFNKWMDCKDAYQADPSCDGNCLSCEYYASAEEEKEAMQMAIAALEQQEKAEDEWCTGCKEYDQEHHCCHRFTKVIRQTVEECKKEWPDSKWYPVTERLPEKDEYVLISKKPTKLSGSKWSVTIAIRTEDPRSRKIQWRDSGFGVIQDDKVLAWCPLPKPYQEDDV